MPHKELSCTKTVIIMLKREHENDKTAECLQFLSLIPGLHSREHKIPAVPFLVLQTR